MNREILKDGVRTYGTPLYVFDLDALQAELDRMRGQLRQSAELCFAMKANPFLTGYCAAQTDRIEVCSMGEFQICRALGIPAEKLIISGVLKKEEDLQEILDACQEKSIYTAESVRQFAALAGWSKKHQKAISVYLRLTSGNQFGMDEKTIRNILQTRDQYPFLKIQGLHFFSGTGKRKLKILEKELAYLDEFLEKTQREEKFCFEDLEYGPGIGVPYFVGEEIETFSDAGLQRLSELIGQMKWKGRVRLELGRAIAARCGSYLTQIRDVKSNGEKHYCIVDGGMHQMNYDGQIRGMYEPYTQLFSVEGDEEGVVPGGAAEPEKKVWTVCGSLCTANDVLCQKTVERDPAVGDVFVFERTGAYSVTEGMALFLSHELPGVVCYSENKGWEPCREMRQSYPWNMWNKKYFE